MADPVSAGLMVAGGLLSAGGQLEAGSASLKEAESQAAQMRLNAGQQRAAGQRAGAEEIRSKDLLMSKMLAMAGASGGGMSDPTLINLFAQAETEGKLAADTAMYNAESQALGMEKQAVATVAAGRARKKASQLSAFGSLLGTAGTVKYKAA